MKYSFIFSFLFLFSILHAQKGPFETLYTASDQARPLSLKNKLQLVFSYEQTYWQNRDKFAKASGYKPYNRFKHFWEKYYDLGVDPAETWWNAYAQILNRPSTDDSNWTLVGATQYTHSGSTEGKGRINAIAVDPNNPDIIYIGAPAGGLWKTTDGGQTWTPLTDQLPSLGVSGIAVDPTDSNTIYIATGDDDARVTPGKGVFKSMDGGQTWSMLGTGLSSGLDFLSDIIINPSDTDIILVASSIGIIRSDDGGSSWNVVLSGSSRSLKKNPANDNVYYAILEDEFYRSTDAGQTWTQVTNGLPDASQTDRMVMAVTPAAPDRVYVYSMQGSASNGVYISYDSGISFVQTSENNNLVDSQQSWYDLALAVSDTDPDVIIKGELNLMRSIDGGDNFYTINDWAVENNAYTHADIHFLAYFNGVLYVGSDGGIYRSYDNGNHFENLNDGLAISQFYRISVAKGQQDPGILGGLQDNGGIAKISDTWNIFHGADGMDNAIDLENPQTGYSFIYYGLATIKTSNGGLNGSNIGSLPEYGNWITPMTMSPANELHAAARRVYKLVNDSWQSVTSSSFNGRIDVMEFHPTNSNLLYVAVNKDLYKSMDGGVSFNFVFQFPQNIYSIALNPDANDIWIAAGSSVYYSTDESNWSVISSGLPTGVVVNDLQYHRFSNPTVIYAGTDIGVYRKSGNNDWEIFSNNLPFSPVYDLELDELSGFLYAATFGRSVWKTPVQVFSPQTDLGVIELQLDEGLTCSAVDQITFRIKNFGLNTINTFNYSYDFNGQTANQTWSGTLNSGETTDITVNLNTPVQYGVLNAYVNISLTNDQVTSNNSLRKNVLVNKSEGIPFIYDFESNTHDLLSIEQSSSTSVWQRANPAGSILNAASSGTYAYCTNPTGNYQNGKFEYLYLPCMDFSNLTDLQIRFDLAFDIEQDWDALYLEYSTDGVNWQILGTSSDPNWYNSNTVQGVCQGAQWTGTESNFATYSHDLDVLEGEPNAYLRFVMASDTYVTGEGAVIDDLQITGTMGIENYDDVTWQIYPNPVENLLNISSAEGIDKVEIINMTGQIISTVTFDHEKHIRLKTGSLSKGSYLLKIYSGDKEAVKHFIKN